MSPKRGLIELRLLSDCTFPDLRRFHRRAGGVDKVPGLPARCGYPTTFARRPRDVIMDGTGCFVHLDHTFTEHGRSPFARPVPGSVPRIAIHHGGSADLYQLVPRRRQLTRATARL